jgi:hypothetical protein
MTTTTDPADDPAHDPAHDPIADHVAALDRVLRGPRRARRCMVAEARAGLRDAAEAHRAEGLPPGEAARRAVRDFGAVHEVAPGYQSELTARQGRRAAVLFVIAFPGMLLAWDALWSTGTVTRGPGEVGNVVRVLAALQDAVTIAVGVAALALLAATFHRALPPRRLTAAIGVTGTVGALACGGTAVAMNVAGGEATVRLLATNPAAVAAFAGSAVVLVLIVWQAVRTLRHAAVPAVDAHSNG